MHSPRLPARAVEAILAIAFLASCGSSKPPHAGAFIKGESEWTEIPGRLRTERMPTGQVRAIFSVELGETPALWRHDAVLVLWWEGTSAEHLGMYKFTLGAQPVGEVDIQVTEQGGDVYEVAAASRMEKGLYCLYAADQSPEALTFDQEWCFRVMP